MSLFDYMFGTEFILNDQGRLPALLLDLLKGSSVQREQRVDVTPLHCVFDVPHQIWKTHIY